MDTILYITEPLIGATIASALMVLIGVALRSFNKKRPEVGNRIKNMTPWLGWTEKEIEDPYNGFRIHSSNYMRG